MNRQDKRRSEREKNKITQILPHAKVTYHNNKRVLTKKQEREIANHIQREVFPYNLLKNVLSDAPYSE
jgi:hypothetical protein